MEDEMRVVTIDEEHKHHRYLYLKNELVSSLDVSDCLINIGKTAVKAAGVGEVKTNEKHRNKGYMKILMNDTLQYMNDNNYDVSILIGLPNFYHKYGYRVCIPTYKLILDIDFIGKIDIPDFDDYNFREIEVIDYENILRLYNEHARGISCTLVRERDKFWGFNRGSDWFTFTEDLLMEDQDGNLLGYVVMDKSDTQMNIVELEAVNTKYYFHILKKLKQISRAKKCEDLHFFLPEDHYFMGFLQRFGCTVHTRYPQNGMGMLRITDLQNFFLRIFPELEKRTKHIFRRGYNSDLKIITDIGTICLKYNNEKLTIEDDINTNNIFQIPQSYLMQVMTGYRALQDVLIVLDDNIHCTNIKFAKLLQPHRKPYIFSTDLF